MLDHLRVKLASSVGGASERKSEGRWFKTHVRLTLYLKLKNLSTYKLDFLANEKYTMCALDSLSVVCFVVLSLGI